MAKCKHGKLKNPVGRRKCKKAPKGKKRGGKKKGTCRYGKLKNPVGSRVCKKKPGGRKKK